MTRYLNHEKELCLIYLFIYFLSKFCTFEFRWLQKLSPATPPSAGVTNRTTQSCSQMARSDPIVMWVCLFVQSCAEVQDGCTHWFASETCSPTKISCFNTLKTRLVSQHAPYDAMVLVSMCWYLDQQLKATEGKWKVNTWRCTSCQTFPDYSFHFSDTHACLGFSGLRCSQTGVLPRGAGVHYGWKSHWRYQSCQKAIHRVGELSLIPNETSENPWWHWIGCLEIGKIGTFPWTCWKTHNSVKERRENTFTETS